MIQTDLNDNVSTSSNPSGGYMTAGCVRIYGFNTAITANTTLTSAPAGSQGITTHATGKGKLFYSDGTKWQFDAIS